ncbi:MAG: hypothetical protein JRF30_10315 [Deltaproteobacteria bacterium]|nr:hypothetical protein [Deltaproteobacteria bacterium]
MPILVVRNRTDDLPDGFGCLYRGLGRNAGGLSEVFKKGAVAIKDRKMSLVDFLIWESLI